MVYYKGYVPGYSNAPARETVDLEYYETVAKSRDQRVLFSVLVFLFISCVTLGNDVTSPLQVSDSSTVKMGMTGFSHKIILWITGDNIHKVLRTVPGT